MDLSEIQWLKEFKVPAKKDPIELLQMQSQSNLSSKNLKVEELKVEDTQNKPQSATEEPKEAHMIKFLLQDFSEEHL